MPVVLQYCDSVQHPFPHGLVQGADVAVVAGVGADVGSVGTGVGDCAAAKAAAKSASAEKVGMDRG